jgi:hypothetical protein
MLSSQSSQSPSPSPDFSSLCTSFLCRCRCGASAPRLFLRLCSAGSSDPRFSPIPHAPHAKRRPSNATIPLRITFFADPHHLTPIESNFYKKQGGGGISLQPKQFLNFPQRVNMQTHNNACNPFPFMGLLHISRHSGVGCHETPITVHLFSACPSRTLRLCVILYSCLLFFLFISRNAWNKCPARASSQVQR